MTTRDEFLIRLGKRSRTLLLAMLLALTSVPAGAVFQGVAGEALLVPFALYDSSHGINTKVSITVPDRVGTATIPNEFTAQHTSPGDYPLEFGTQLTLRYTFYNAQGSKRAEGLLQTTPNSLLTLDWGRVVTTQFANLTNEPGYLMIQTEAGAVGNEADFNLFGHAKMTFDGRSASIPVLALSDGEDASGVTAPPTLENEAVGTIRHSPLAAGVRTGLGDDGPGVYSLIDLVVGKRFWKFSFTNYPQSSYWKLVSPPTLLVVWNDHNDAGWNAINADAYDTVGQSCSLWLPMNKQLNLFWISPPGVPSFGPTYIDTVSPCSPTGSIFSSTTHVRLKLPSPQQDSASAAFSIVFAGDQAETLLARERGLSDLLDLTRGREHYWRGHGLR